MIKTVAAAGEVKERLVEKDLVYMKVYSATPEVLSKYLSRGCLICGYDGDIVMICDAKIPELIEGYHCARCGRDTFYDGYVIHLDS